MLSPKTAAIIRSRLFAEWADQAASPTPGRDADARRSGPGTDDHHPPVSARRLRASSTRSATGHSRREFRPTPAADCVRFERAAAAARFGSRYPGARRQLRFRSPAVTRSTAV